MLQIFLKKLLQIFIFTLLLSSSTHAQTALQRLDGEWYSPQWRYGYSLKNGLGVATSTNSPNFQIGQTIIQLSATSATTFTGQQVYTDGNFYRVNVILQPDGRLYFEGEKNAKWLMERVATAPQSIGNKNNDYQNLLLGKWYHKTEDTDDNFTLLSQSVQDFLPNGTISEQAQYVVTNSEARISCLANTTWEWSTSGNKIYQKVTGSHVVPDFIKDHNGRSMDNTEMLNKMCEIIKKEKSQRQLTTSVFTIIKIDNKVNVYQYQDSKGVIQESTDYRVNQGLSYFKVK